MPVSCECCVLSGGGFSPGIITCLEEYYPLWVPECDHEVSVTRGPRPTLAVCAMEMNSNLFGALLPPPTTG